MIKVERNDDENVESLIRRFKKKVLQNGVVIEARKRRFYEPPKSKKQLREDAKRRSNIRDKKEHLKRIGKMDQKPKFRRY